MNTPAQKQKAELQTCRALDSPDPRFYDNADDPTQRSDLKEDLEKVWGVNLDSATLASLNGKRLICKYKSNPTTTYYVEIIAQ